MNMRTKTQERIDSLGREMIDLHLDWSKYDDLHEDEVLNEETNTSDQNDQSNKKDSGSN